MFLNEAIEVAFPERGKLVRCTGTIVGRTLGAQRRYDVRLPGGRIIANVPESQLRALALDENPSH